MALSTLKSEKGSTNKSKVPESGRIWSANVIAWKNSSCDTLHKAREAYLIERGQTLEAKGVNKREEI